MSKTIIVCGFGPGISTGVAEKFGKEGFDVAIVARNADKLAAGAKALQAKGIQVAAFPCDLADPTAVRKLVADVRDKLGPVAAIHWNAYGGGAGDLMKADPAAIRAELDVAVTSLVVAVQEAHADLEAQKGAVLVTNGGFGYSNPQVDAMNVEYGAMGLGLANAAKHKLVGMLAMKLKGDGVYVGQIVVMGTVKGTPWDQGNASLEGSQIAEKFWSMHRARSETSVEIA